ncbi:beta-ketoacyl-ACP synthase II [Treponema sp. Marseille-Q3903]|uniref:beta-ketoacyl-ACP synthase II n=1 Tax=Treponema sp. Marseille-Q3903 TaxID=2766703 RepID=UPI0016525C94|nr:beta-ketoacyl-ACP synthase II [Treponema sp. Marseille-Q3903]MBC6714315.1 beta-ketoacyl-ACP synthase II [Treponema sp. Marseille-Q3903]
MAQRRVVVTGLGCVSSVGNNVNDSWNAVKNGKSGIANITLFDASKHLVRIAGEVKDFDINNYDIDRKMARKISRVGKFLLGASIEAVNDSGYTAETIGKENTGIITGVGIGISEECDNAYSKYYDPNCGVNRIPPLTAPFILNNEPSAGVAMHFGIHGSAWTLSTACASGTDALGLALDMIRIGRMDVCLAGGVDANVTGFDIGCYQALSALTTKFNDNPKKASRPFDRDRSGFVMAEGAAVLILEEYEHAKKRGAHIYAELAGYGGSSDAYHITAPCPDGAGGVLAMKKAFADAGMTPEDIQYYNAHGTSTVANDVSETIMLKSVFGKHAYKLHISSTKSETGHLVGAAGAIEAIFCIKALEDNFVPPTINLDNPDVEHGCDLDYTPNKGVECELNAVASCSLGFGGHNGCVIFKKI